MVESRVELLLFGTDVATGTLDTLLEETDADLVIVESQPGESTGPNLADALRRHRPATRVFVLSEVPATAPAAPEDFGSLTARERQVLELLAGGNDLKAISRNLGISLHTTRGHVKNLLSKLDAHSQLEAVVTATRRGYLTPASTAVR